MPSDIPFILFLFFRILPLNNSDCKPALPAAIASKLNILLSAARSLFVLERASIIPSPSTPTFLKLACNSMIFL